MEQKNNKNLGVLEKSFQNVRKFAEILYKCKLCTSLPSILTSEECFLAHVNNTHLQDSNILKRCPSCPLKFRTKEDLWAHKKLMHSDFDSDYDSSEDNEENFKVAQQMSTNDVDSEDKPVECNKRKRGLKEKFMRKRKIKDVKGIKEEEEMEQDPHFVISHGAEGMSTPSPKNDSADLQKLTDQIASDASPGGCGGISTNYLSSTPEFGKYTKLVREGGNIVYFCQVCNWKTQMKIMFSEHCKSTAHLVKVTVAEQTDNLEKSSSARGHFMSFLDEKINFYINKKLSSESLNSESNHCDGKDQTQNGKDVSGKSIKENDEDEEIVNVVVKSEPVESDLTPTEGRRSRRKRKVTNMIMQALAGESEEESDNPDNTRKHTKNKMSRKVIGVPIAHVPKKLEMESQKLRLVKLQNSASDFPPFNATKSADQEESQNEVESKKNDENNQIMGTDKRGYQEITETDTHTSHEQKNLTANLTDIIARTVDTEINQRVTDKDINQSSPCYFLYRCSLCPFGCNDISQYRVHFETEHEPEQTDTITDIGYTDCKTEQKKIQKIKELLPCVVVIHPRGNVSRDLLLQKASIMSNEPEIALWGPACNRAVREMFPDSLAQRKGKYKKTYFFGIALIEQLQEQEAASNDSTEVEFTALRDMTQDLDRILQHLPTIVKWKGDLEAGVSRDDVLHMLGRRIEDPEVLNWGLQCNRAIRILFPQVQMKRKGKYKATVYFGVTFSDRVSRQDFASLVEPKVKPIQKPVIKDDGIKPKLTWRDAIRTVDNRGLTARDMLRKSIVTRGWGPFNPPTSGIGISSNHTFITDGPPPNVRADMLPSVSSLPTSQEHSAIQQALTQGMPLLRYHLTTAEMSLYEKYGADPTKTVWHSKEQLMKAREETEKSKKNDIKHEMSDAEDEKSNDADDENSQSTNGDGRGSPFFSNKVAERVETKDGIMYIKREIDSDSEK